MLELAGDERLRHVGQVVLVVGVVERVAAALEQRLVHVHARPVLAVQRLRHEGRVEAVLHRVLLHRDAVRHAVVGHLQRVREAHVDLVLGGPDLVVAVLDVDAELLQRQHGLAPQVRAGVERREVEVAALVEHLRRAAAGLRRAEVEVLQLRPDVEVVEAHALRTARVRAAGPSAGRPRRAPRREPGRRRTSARSPCPPGAREGSRRSRDRASRSCPTPRSG